MASNLRSLSRELLFPFGLFIGIAAGGAWLGSGTDRNAELFFQNGLAQVGDLARARLEDYVAQQERALEYAAEEILPREFEFVGASSDAGLSSADFQQIGGAISDWLPGFLAVNWVGLDGVIELVSPALENQSALRQNLLEHSDPGVVEALREALATSDVTSARVGHSPLVELYQGGRGFALYLPVFGRDGALLGVLNASFRVEDLLRTWLLATDLSGHAAFAVFDSGGAPLFSSGPELLTEDWPYTTDLEIDVLDAPWRLRVGPSPDWLDEGLSLHGQTITATSLLLGLLVGALSFAFSRKRTQQEQADLRLGLALEGARLGVWDLDLVTGSLHLNDRWLAMLGYGIEDVHFGLDFYRSLVHPDDLAVVEVAMRDHLSGRTEVYRTEHRLRARTGEWVWVLDAGRIVERDGRGRPLRVAGTQTNFTDIRRAEQELERSVGRYRSIFEHSPIGLLEQDMSSTKQVFDGLRAEGVEDLGAYFAARPDQTLEFKGQPVVLDINPALLGLFRATSLAECKRNVVEMVDARARRAYEQVLIALFAGESTCEVDFPLTDLDGKQLLYTVRMTVAPGCRQDLSSVFVSVVDNTRRLREEEQRRLVEARDRQAQKDESLALLAGGVAHDFNNLLVPIIGNIELTMHDLPAGDAARVNLRRAEQAAQRAADLARQMLTYSGRGQVQSETFDVNALVREMSDLLSSSLPGKVDLVTDLAEGPLGMEGDPTQLRQLVMNLVINAADAVGGEPGRVVVRTGKLVPTRAELEGGFLGEGLVERECAFIDVRDTGKGVDEETRKRMFEPFFSTKSRGRGLGMSVVLGIVRGHGGALTVTSRLGKGTRIRAYMPSRELPAPAQQPVAGLLSEGASDLGTPGERSGGRVLFVDDEPQVRRFAVAALGRIGIEIECACDGVEGLERWRAQPGRFDLVILDATMPRMGGVEAMEEIRREAPDQPVVLSSGYTQQGVASRAAESAQCWFLPKPFGVSELNRLVARVLGELGSDPSSGE